VRARDAAIFDINTSNTPNSTKGQQTRSPVHSFGSPASPSGSPQHRLPHQQHSTERNSRSAAAMRRPRRGTDSETASKPPLTTRRRYHIALGAARQLLAGGELSATGCGALKNHIFDDDGRVAAAVEIFWLNDDGDALLATLRALGLGATAPG
jgi:hypothetical protein